MGFWDSVSGFLGDVNNTVSSLADTWGSLGEAGIVDIGPSGGGGSGGPGGFGGTPYGTGYSFPPPATLAAPGASTPEAAQTPAFVWILGAIAMVYLVKN